MWQSFSSRFESLVFSCIKKNKKKTNPTPFFYAQTFPFLLDRAGTALTVVLLWFSLQISVDFQSIFSPHCFCLFILVVQIDPRIDRGTQLSIQTPFFKASSEFGLHTIFTLAHDVSTPPQISFFHVIDGWRLVSDIQNSAVVRLDCDTGWVHSSRPWVLHSRRSWLERRRKVGGRIWSGQIFRHLFFFTDWLAVKVIMIITQGQVRYTGRQSTLYLSLFFFTVQDGQG